MKAAHARLGGAQDEEVLVAQAPAAGASDRRRENRYDAQFQAVLHLADGTREDVELADISMHGCCIRSETEGLRIGRFISIGIDEEPLLQAVIRWVRDGAAGMEFLRPIPPDRYEWHELMDMPL